MFLFPRDAACAGVDWRLFFPVETEAGEVRDVDRDRALAYCDACPVRQGCAEFALEHGYDAGIFGGMTPAARRELRARAPAA